jgi:hypothetical protein
VSKFRTTNKLDRRDTSALEHRTEILQDRDQIAHRLDAVGLKIAPPDDAFISDEVIRISGHSVMVAMRANTGRFSLSTTARALIDLNVSGASCIANISRFGRDKRCHFVGDMRGHGEVSASNHILL